MHRSKQRNSEQIRWDEEDECFRDHAGFRSPCLQLWKMLRNHFMASCSFYMNAISVDLAFQTGHLPAVSALGLKEYK